MRKIFALLAMVLALAAAGGVSAQSAQAAASCGIHHLDILGWSEQSNEVDPDWEFQCGGAVNSNFRIVFHLQLHEPTGQWDAVYCGASGDGSICTVNRPSGNTTWFGDGTDHGGWPSVSDFSWTVNGPSIKGLTFRVQAVVHFQNGDPNVIYYSLAQLL